MSTNQEYLARSLNAVWHPCTQMKQHEQLPLVPIERGEGCWLHDFDGRRYLDAISSWWVNLFGHANPRINAAIADQMNRLEHVMLAGFTHRPVVELSERLAALTDNALGHCFYASDGASATEIALKMSHHFWRNGGRPEKDRFVCLTGSYHGETVGALGVTDVAIFRDAYRPLLHAAATVDTPDARKAGPGEKPEGVARRAAAALERHFSTHADRTAALIVEPLVQCASGMAMYDPEYLRLARGLCDRHGVHLIVDEIAVGCGRTGSFFAHEQAGIRPDFRCLSKGISGGYLPLSIVLTTDAIYRAFYDDKPTRGFLHSHSYTGNALACRAALATLDIFEQDDVLARNQARADLFARLCAPLAADRRLRHLRQRGMIVAFDAITDDPAFANRMFAACLEREVLLRPIGNTVYFMPPYILSDTECELLVTRTREALDAVLR